MNLLIISKKNRSIIKKRNSHKSQAAEFNEGVGRAVTF